MKARPPPFERDPGVPTEGALATTTLLPRSHAAFEPSRPYGADERPLQDARAAAARAINMPATCSHVR